MTDRISTLLKVHFDCMEVVNRIAERECSVLTKAAIKYTKIKQAEKQNDRNA